MPPNTDDSGGQIFDVSKPGQTAPSAQSRPVIVGHRTLLQDPMVVKSEKPQASQDSDTKAGNEPSAILAQSAKSISPPTQPTTAGDSPTADETISPEPAANKPEDTGAALAENQTNQATPKKPTEPQKQAEAAKQEALLKLAQDKKYYVPIGAKKTTQSIQRLLVIIIVVLLLGIILGDLLIDSGAIKTSIRPPLRIFHHAQ